MKQHLILALAALALATGCPRESKEAGAGAAGGAPQTEDQKILYAMGLDMGRQLKSWELTREELSYIQAGLEAQVTGQEPAVKLEEYGPKIREFMRSRQQARAEKEKAKSTEFLAKAAQEEGVQKTESGLLYKELTPGTGPSPTPQDMVKVHYRGTLIDGTEFDSSFKRNEPATFPLGGVIRCWTEGLQKMKAGGKSRLICPPEIAYGERGAPPNIPGNAALIFEVELLEVIPRNPPPPPPGQPAQAQPQQQKK